MQRLLTRICVFVGSHVVLLAAALQAGRSVALRSTDLVGHRHRSCWASQRGGPRNARNPWSPSRWAVGGATRILTDGTTQSVARAPK